MLLNELHQKINLTIIIPLHSILFINHPLKINELWLSKSQKSASTAVPVSPSALTTPFMKAALSGAWQMEQPYQEALY